MAEKKPVVTFNKAYIIERIEARMASLKSKVEIAKNDITAFAASQEAQVDEAFFQNVEYVNNALRVAADEAVAEYEKLTDPKAKRNVASKFASKISAVGTFPTWPTYSRFNEKNRIVGEYTGMKDEDRIIFEQADIPVMQREVSTLEHTLAYLRESPVDEYSITGLRSLGLLEAIKFVIPK